MAHYYARLRAMLLLFLLRVTPLLSATLMMMPAMMLAAMPMLLLLRCHYDILSRKIFIDIAVFMPPLPLRHLRRMPPRTYAYADAAADLPRY